MRIDSDACDHVAEVFFTMLSPYLDEKLLRLSAGALASAFGGDSVSVVATAAGLAARTVRAGMEDLADGSAPVERVRRPGGGRPRIEESQPGLWESLNSLIEPEERGDPMNPLRWTIKSTRALSDELAARGFKVSHSTVGDLLRDHGYSLRGTVKVLAGKAEHGPDRDRQFRYINDITRAFLAEGQPVISVDTKKKEQVGNFERPGQTWRGYKDPIKVADHSFPDATQPVVAPYGVLDMGANRGYVNLGISHDTPSFAVASITRWWKEIGQATYPKATRLQIISDSGGSNSARSLVYKAQLHQFALESGLEVTMAHMPPGTSKWNKIEHRLFAQISRNWQGKPLTSLEAVVSSIAATTTRTGLTVHCVLDERDYPTGITSNWDHINRLPITFHEFQPTWNYTIKPEPLRPAPETTPTKPKNRRTDKLHTRDLTPVGDQAERTRQITALTVPEITGIDPEDWADLATQLEPAYRQLREQETIATRGRPSAYPTRHWTGLKTPITQLMLATILHERHRLSTTQISRLIEMTSAGVGKHIPKLATLFAELGHPITPTGTKIKTIEQLYELTALPQQPSATHHEEN